MGLAGDLAALPRPAVGLRIPHRLPGADQPSFNVRGEPIVCTPEDAYRCFMRSEIDDLVLGDLLLEKEQQPARPDDDSWRQEFTLD